MDFDLTDEQRLLRDSVDRLLADTYTFEKRKGYSAEPEGWSRALWSRYAELGILGLPFAEEHGGFGGGGIETMLVMEAFGCLGLDWTKYVKRDPALMRPAEVDVLVGDASKARRDLGWKPAPFDEGVRLTIDHFRRFGAI